MGLLCMPDCTLAVADTLDSLNSLTRLSCLDIEGIYRREPAALEQLTRLTQLQRLVLGGGDGGPIVGYANEEPWELQAALAGFPSLTELEIRQHGL